MLIVDQIGVGNWVWELGLGTGFGNWVWELGLGTGFGNWGWELGSGTGFGNWCVLLTRNANIVDSVQVHQYSINSFCIIIPYQYSMQCSSKYLITQVPIINKNYL
jgi:hypothetical protein